MQATVLQRDTDADWRELGARDPFWGVITHPDYRAENLNDQKLEAFYASGETYIGDIAARLERATGTAPHGQALDFGCGVGRLSEAMARRATVTGLDISPGMLAKARERGAPVTYTDTLPDGPFDWINSFIVFQHIPPARGLALLNDLLARLAPGGLISLQLTFWRDAHLSPDQGHDLRARYRRWRWEREAARLPTGTMRMYDYPLSEVVQALKRAGLGELTLLPTNHDGYHGAIILAQKAGVQ
ncbi:class I SAM-dependent methyltransferase [Phenylobacterium sp.]|uniref:class I SAM-dependent methyltransferase n=1 Tax=Phenylobacterium sp. TaxID=1871053 RepID=UPI0030F45FBA